MTMLQNFHLEVIKYLYRGRRAVPLHAFTTWHSNRNVVHSYSFANRFYAMNPETTKFGNITQNKSHFAVQGHSSSPILVPIESSIRLPISD